jgi:UDPglucose 6-dehydrogenase
MAAGAAHVKVCVYGLWHLGTVTAACLADAGHDVVGLDDVGPTLSALADGVPPLFEPGLQELIEEGLASGRLRFSGDPRDALREADVLWVAFDTPVDENDRADVSFVSDRVSSVYPYLERDALVLVSSQLPVGSTAALETAFARAFPDRAAAFAYAPENLRLGRAIDVFTSPDRVVVGVRSDADRERVAELLGPITERFEWMSVESAEMTKHAINAFLATSVAFMNELATICEKTGADAKEVERGLKSETRIGPRAYLAPGSAIAGGTLARDLEYLSALGRRTGLVTHVVDGVRDANQAHRSWTARRLTERLTTLAGRSVGVLGLTYKPGTDTLRRSGAVELCRWLSGQEADVRAHDPAVTRLPDDLAEMIHLAASPTEMLAGLDALVVATEWPAFKQIDADCIVAGMAHPLVVDPNRFLHATLGVDPRISYDAVGSPS